jgi:ribosomal protein L24
MNDLKPGDKVRVIMGAYNGSIGEVLKYEGADVVVRIELETIKLPVYALKKVD